MTDIADGTRTDTTAGAQQAAREFRLELMKRKLAERGLSSTAADSDRNAGADPNALSDGQRRMWFVQAVDPSGVLLNICLSYRLTGIVDADRLHTALIASVYASGASAEPEHDSQLGHDALDLAGRVRSRRVPDRITDLAKRLHPHRRDPVVDRFLRRARVYASAMSPG